MEASYLVACSPLRWAPLEWNYDQPVFDLNPQNAAFHTFATECGNRFSETTATRSAPQAPPATRRAGPAK
jgi:hypothetical protein